MINPNETTGTEEEWEDLMELAEQWEQDHIDDYEADADALASAGFGTDEDYGYFGDDF